MPKYINVMAAQVSVMGEARGSEGMVLVPQRLDPRTHHPSADESQCSEQPRMADFHGWRPCLLMGGGWRVAGKAELVFSRHPAPANRHPLGPLSTKHLDGGSGEVHVVVGLGPI